MERIELQDMTPRVEGCAALLCDDGSRQDVPACMGGTAIVGCVDYGTCGRVSKERWDDPTRAQVGQCNEDGVVIRECTVRPGDYTSQEIAERQAAVAALLSSQLSRDEVEAALDAHDRQRISARKAIMQAASPEGVR